MGEYEEVGSRRKSSPFPATKKPLPGREGSSPFVSHTAGYKRRERRPKEYAAYAVSN